MRSEGRGLSVPGLFPGSGKGFQPWVGHERNCWEIKNCSSKEECPAYGETRLNGVHGGINGGRACWLVKGNTCGFKVNDSCDQCEFYRTVLKEEGMEFRLKEELAELIDQG